MVQCAICGDSFRPTGHGKRQKYCSESCRNRSKYLRRKTGTVTPKQTVKKSNPTGSNPATQQQEEPVGLKLQAEFNRRDFERMMDDPLEDVLRMNRDRLKAALEDPDTPANALPNISKQLIAVCDRLTQMSGDDNLFDDVQEVTEDEYAGAQII